MLITIFKFFGCFNFKNRGYCLLFYRSEILISLFSGTLFQSSICFTSTIAERNRQTTPSNQPPIPRCLQQSVRKEHVITWRKVWCVYWLMHLLPVDFARQQIQHLWIPEDTVLCYCIRTSVHRLRTASIHRHHWERDFRAIIACMETRQATEKQEELPSNRYTIPEQDVPGRDISPAYGFRCWGKLWDVPSCFLSWFQKAVQFRGGFPRCSSRG